MKELKELDRNILDIMKKEHDEIITGKCICDEDEAIKIHTEREIHLISGLNQVLLRTMDKEEHMDYLLDRAMVALDKCNNTVDKVKVYGDGGLQ